MIVLIVGSLALALVGLWAWTIGDTAPVDPYEEAEEIR